MRAAGIVKIVIGSVLVVVLVSVMLGVIGGRFVWERLGVQDMIRDEIIEHLPDSVRSGDEHGTAPIVGSASFAAEEIREIDAEWIAGDVVVSIGEGTEVVVSESCAVQLTDAQKMRCYLSNGKLKIEYCDNADSIWDWFLGGSYWIPSKTLYLELPASLMTVLNELDIETVSADVQFDAVNVQGKDLEVTSVSGSISVMNLDVKELSATNVSGSITLKNCRADKLDIETVSGRVKATDGAYVNVDAEAVSGAIELVCVVAPQKMDVETVSGKVSIWLPADAEFTARLSTVSGRLSSEIPCVMSQNQLTSGSGTNRYAFESVSGSVEILANP